MPSKHNLLTIEILLIVFPDWNTPETTKVSTYASLLFLLSQISVDVRSCELGEVTNELGDACEPCSPGSFSLNPANFSCDECPAHAVCPGGVQLVPDVGYWHSSVSSPQMHT